MLEQKVLNWLQTTGFPLEMATADAFRKVGFEIRQSTLYIDMETTKSREIDIVAVDQDWIGAIQISVVLECKSSSKPWVVLKSQDAWANFNRIGMHSIMSDPARKILSSGIEEKLQGHLARPSEGGYGLRQALSDGGDSAYTAAVSVLKACLDVARSEKGLASTVASFAFPVIVVDTPIYECTLMESGDLNLVEVRESEFLFACHTPKYTATCIKIVTKSELPAFAKKIKSSVDLLRADLKSEERKILDSF